MFPLPGVVFSVAAQNAALAAKRATALERKKAAQQKALGQVRTFADNFASSSRANASSLLAQADADRARLASLQGEGDSSTAPSDGASRGFFSSKGLLIVGGLVAVLLILRR